MSYLLDTCIVSKLRKISKQPDKKLEEWIQKHDENTHFISVLTLGEIQSGISQCEDQTKRIILEDWFREDLLPRFNNRIIAVDGDVGLIWGKLYGENKKKGNTIPLVDGLIAATAIVHNLTLVTENIHDFLKTGVRLFNPWL